MKFEISGIGYPNKGAELMLRAAGEALVGQYGKDTVVTSIPATRRGTGYRCLGANGYHLRFALVVRGRDYGALAGKFLPRTFLRSYGCYAVNEIDHVLDASGLRYTDKWGVGTLKRAIRDYGIAKRRGSKVVMLPQAFGPFHNAEVRKLFPKLIEKVDLVYARDSISLNYVKEIVGDLEKIKLAPDFTPLVEGIDPPDAERFAGKVCVIPNARMLDMTKGDVGSNYFDLMRQAIRTVQEKKLKLFVLNHEGAGDDALCREFCKAFSPELPYTEERDARVIKGIIGSSAGLLTSRFHGLMSGLCQGVPSVSTSWNHKYEELCREYKCPNAVIDPLGSIDEITDTINNWTEAILDGSGAHSKQLLECAKVHKDRIHNMWAEIFDFLGT